MWPRLVLPLLVAASCVLGEEAHGSSEGSFEWAGLFAVDAEDVYTWTAQIKADASAYAEGTMAIVLLPAADGTEATLHGLEDAAKDAFGHTPCTVVEPGGTIVPATHTCFELHFEGGDTSTFTIEAAGLSHLAIFTEHDPAEFERDTHYLTVSHGDHADDVEALHILSEGDHEELEAEAEAAPSRVGEAVLAGFAASSASLIGLALAALILALRARQRGGGSAAELDSRVSSAALGFSAGTLLSATFLLLLPEAGLNLEAAYGAGAESKWRLGALTLSGILGGAVLGWLAHHSDLCRHSHIHTAEECTNDACEAYHPAELDNAEQGGSPNGHSHGHGHGHGPAKGHASSHGHGHAHGHAQATPRAQTQPQSHGHGHGHDHGSGEECCGHDDGASPDGEHGEHGEHGEECCGHEHGEGGGGSEHAHAHEHGHAHHGKVAEAPVAVAARTASSFEIDGAKSVGVTVLPPSLAAAVAAPSSMPTKRARMGIVLPVLLGDGLHNAVDGVLIGVAAQVSLALRPSASASASTSA